MKRPIAVVFVAFVMLVAAGPSIGAAGVGKPIAVQKFDNQFEQEVDPFLSEVCGIEVLVSGSDKGTEKVYADGSVRVHFNSVFELHSPETGETLVRRDAANARFFGEETFDPATGYLTINFDDTFKGLPVQWSKPGEGVLLRDAGIARFQGTVVIDTVAGEEVSFEETITTKGPHPELGIDVIAFICDALGA